MTLEKAKQIVAEFQAELEVAKRCGADKEYVDVLKAALKDAKDRLNQLQKRLKALQKQ